MNGDVGKSAESMLTFLFEMADELEGFKIFGPGYDARTGSSEGALVGSKAGEIQLQEMGARMREEGRGKNSPQRIYF